MNIPETPKYVPNRPCKTPSYTNEDLLTYDAPDMTYYLTNVEDTEIAESSTANPITSKVVKRVKKRKTVPKIIAKLIKKKTKNKERREKREEKTRF